MEPLDVVRLFQTFFFFSSVDVLLELDSKLLRCVSDCH